VTINFSDSSTLTQSFIICFGFDLDRIDGFHAWQIQPLESICRTLILIMSVKEILQNSLIVDIACSLVIAFFTLNHNTLMWIRGFIIGIMDWADIYYVWLLFDDSSFTLALGFFENWAQVTFPSHFSKLRGCLGCWSRIVRTRHIVLKYLGTFKSSKKKDMEKVEDLLMLH